MWRSKPAASRTWSTKWKRVNWIRVLSSRMLRPSHTVDFTVWWTSSLGDSLASPSQSPESRKGLRTQGTCSPTSLKEFMSANPELFSSKTSKESSQPRPQMGSQFSSMSSEAWKKWVTEQRQEYSVRKKSAHHTSGKGSLSWPTASTRDHKGGYVGGRIRNGKISMDTLDVAVQAHTTGGLVDQAKSSTTGKPQGSRKWPTPRANQVQPIITEENRAHLANRKKANLEEEIAGHCGKAVGQLNPDWVEHLMGLPSEWTDFECLGMEWSLR